MGGTLLAWIQPGDRDEFLAAFVGADAAAIREPATQQCSSAEEARQWVEDQAAALGVAVEWVNPLPAR